MGIADDAELEKIEEQIDQCLQETREWRKKKAEAEESIKGESSCPSGALSSHPYA